MRQARHSLDRMMVSGYWRLIGPRLHQRFLMDLIAKTGNFSRIKWLGHPIWQNILDLWTIQETLHEIQPDLLIESGTHRGGSALFFAHLFDLMGKGRVVTIDVDQRHEVTHPRITFLTGNSTTPDTLQQIRRAVDAVPGPVMVILDSDHHSSHVAMEMEAYSRFVTVDSYMLVQDGVIDIMPTLRSDRPGPLPAIRQFLRGHPEFEIDRSRSSRFLVTHHPLGWLRRLPDQPLSSRLRH